MNTVKISMLIAVLTIAFTLSWNSNGQSDINLSEIDSECDSSKGPFDEISGVYYAYKAPPASYSNPLGCPVSEEKRFSDNILIGFGQDVDKYQEFEHGTIYYNSQEKSAFALFNNLDLEYKKIKNTYGLPISSEIGNANVYPYNCRAYFSNGYIKCKSNDYGAFEISKWAEDQVSTEDILQWDYPVLSMPFDKNENGKKGTFNSGPHSYGGDIYGLYSPGQGSGIDIGVPKDADGNLQSMNVYAMAPGTIIDVFPNPDIGENVVCTNQPTNTGFGCWVAIRHDFSGTIMIYGHIEPDQAIKVGTYIKTGNLLGQTTDGFIGNSDGPHVHLEFRSGTSYCSSNCVNLDPNIEFGQPIDWHGLAVDTSIVSGGVVTNNNSRYQYDGTVVIVNREFEQRKYSDDEITNTFGDILVNADWKFQEYNQPNFKPITSWLTTDAWDNCLDYPYHEYECEYIARNIETNPWYGTVFSFGGLFSTNEPLIMQGISSESSLVGGFLTSSNSYKNLEPRYEDPYPNPVNTPTPGAVITNCPTDNRDGVYLYEDKNYAATGDCYYTKTSTPNLALTEVGNDRLSSVKIIGDYTIKLYEDINYAGRYDELSDSDPNLDIRSLGDQYSSVKIEDSTIPCPSDGREGVYMYSVKDYGGNCLYTTVSIPFFGDTVMGNDNLSSIRFIGAWEAKIYEDANYLGRYDVIGSNDPNLDIRSLGEQYSSVKITKKTPTPTPTVPPNTVILLSSSINNGGFESGNLSGWTPSGGTFTLDTLNPHSGSWYVKGTSATEAKFYRYFDVSSYSKAINEGRVKSSWKVYIDVGGSEEYKFNVRFLDSANNALYSYGTGWTWHDGGYDDRGQTLIALPANTAKIYLEMNMRRSMNDFTDCDVDDFYLDLYIEPAIVPTPTVEPTATPLPDCLSSFSDSIVLHDYAYCNNSAGVLKINQTNIRFNLADYSLNNKVSSLIIPDGWSLIAYEGENGSGEWKCLNSSNNDLSGLPYDSGLSVNNSISSIVGYSDRDCPQIQASNFVYLHSLLAGEQVHASYKLKNISGRTLLFSGILAGVHGPYCTQWDCPNISDFPWLKDKTIAHGEIITYDEKRMFNIVNSQYLLEFQTLDNKGLWKSYMPTTSFAVGRGIEIIKPVTLNPSQPAVGQETTAEFSIRNFGDRSITLPHLIVIAKGPNCSSWDCPDGWADFPWVDGITLDPGGEYTYSQSRSFDKAGTGYFADAAFGDDNIWWYEIPNNERYLFSVLEVAQFKFSPANNEKLTSSKVRFDWDDIAVADQYKIQLSTDESFINKLVNTRTNASDFSFDAPLLFGKTYYWRIRPFYGEVKGPWSSTWRFYSMDPLSTPLLVSPLHKSTSQGNDVILNWEAVENGDRYKIQVSTDVMFLNRVMNQFVYPSELPITKNFDDGKYYWRVRAIEKDGIKGPWSSIWIFKVYSAQ